MSASAPNRNKKPIFGPPVSPEIFANKWNSKFEEHLHKREGAIKSVAESWDEYVAWLATMMGFGEGLLELLLHAQREAKSIGLNLTAKAAEKGLRYVWEKMELSKVLINGLVDRFKSAKNGNLLHGVMGWRDLPLPLHRRINNLVSDVGEIVASGKWVMIGRERVRVVLESTGSREDVVEWIDSLPYE